MIKGDNCKYLVYVEKDADFYDGQSITCPFCHNKYSRQNFYHHIKHRQTRQCNQKNYLTRACELYKYCHPDQSVHLTNRSEQIISFCLMLKKCMDHLHENHENITTLFNLTKKQKRVSRKGKKTPTKHDKEEYICSDPITLFCHLIQNKRLDIDDVNILIDWMNASDTPYIRDTLIEYCNYFLSQKEEALMTHASSLFPLEKHFVQEDSFFSDEISLHLESILNRKAYQYVQMYFMVISDPKSVDPVILPEKCGDTAHGAPDSRLCLCKVSSTVFEQYKMDTGNILNAFVCAFVVTEPTPAGRRLFKEKMNALVKEHNVDF
ncbi:hypothetical protein CI610_01411 [invertebrate metagenome]|uniref:Uncharacterized protein n=1 Tax=invertebrate metagenome TaxID=1711999 RepID=A0A2H9T8P5_9ZZZZ